MRHAHWVFRRMHAPVRAGLRKAALFPVRLPGLIAGLPADFRGTRTGCFFSTAATVFAAVSDDFVFYAMGEAIFCRTRP